MKPTALFLEICKERLPSTVLVDSTHRGPERKSLFDEREDAYRRADHVRGGEMRSALAAFHAVPGVGLNDTKLLILGDMVDSRIHEELGRLGLHLHQIGDPRMRKLRDQHIAASIYSAARLGHKTIVAPMGANHVEGVEFALDLMSGSYVFPAEVGAFVSERGIDKLMYMKQKILKDIPARRIQRVFQKQDNGEALAGREKDLLQKLRVMTSDTRVWRKLQSDGCVQEPDSFAALSSWYSESASGDKIPSRAPKGRGGKPKVRARRGGSSESKSSRH
eukprot:UN0948